METISKKQAIAETKEVYRYSDTKEMGWTLKEFIEEFTLCQDLEKPSFPQRMLYVSITTVLHSYLFII